MGQIPVTPMTAEESAEHDRMEAEGHVLKPYTTQDWSMSAFLTAWFKHKGKDEWSEFADAMRDEFIADTKGKFDRDTLTDAALNQRLGIYKMHLAKLDKKAPPYPERPQPETLAQIVEMGTFPFESL